MATVVIGGLISATALTLVVLPVLYALFERKRGTQQVKKSMKTIVTILLLLLVPALGYSQTKEISADQAVEIALRNNLGLKASALRINQSNQLIGSSIDIDKTEFYYNKDENNFAPNNVVLNKWLQTDSIKGAFNLIQE